MDKLWGSSRPFMGLISGLPTSRDVRILEDLKPQWLHLLATLTDHSGH